MIDGQDYYDIRGIWFKDKDTIITNPVRPYIKSLDHIPFQDYDYKSHYILNNESIQKMDIELLNRHFSNSYRIMATRGCPFTCTYCCNNTFKKMHPNEKPVRKRSINNIIKELIKAKELLPSIDNIYFYDDSFFSFSLNEIKEFCVKYKKYVCLPLSIYGATPKTLTIEKLSLLVEAGLILIRMGIQTGSERTKKLYNRLHTNDQVEKAVKIINQFKDKIEMIDYDIILDNPWETDDDLIKTLMFLSKLPTPYRLLCYSLTIYPGTELYIKAEADGIITENQKDAYRKDFYHCNRTYMNKLFFLLKNYALNGFAMTPKIMLLLTNQKMRQLHLHWLLYIPIRIYLFFAITIKRFNSLVQKGLEAIQTGDWHRIHRYIRRHF